MKNMAKNAATALKLAAVCCAVFAAGGANAAGADDGHSHGHDKHGEGEHKHDFSAIGEPAAAEDAARTVDIVMHDNYYEPAAVAVKKGEIVRFAVKNEGLLVHEFNIGTAEMHAAHKDEMLMMMRHGVLFPDRIDYEKMEAGGEDGHSMKHDDPNSVLLEPGAAGEVVWKFSKDAVLEFACNVPGHYEAGMLGAIHLQ